MAMVVVLPLLAGCDGLLGGNKPKPPPLALAGTGMDMFAPRTVRLHPLTRITTEEGKSVIEAHVECVDQFGDTTKTVGILAFDLWSPTLLSARGNLLEHWELSLDLPKENKDRWDSITRTYVIKHPLPAGTGVPLELGVTLTLANGEKLAGEFSFK